MKFVILIGVAIGYGIAVSYLDGGYDALVFYLKAPFPETTTPAWVYLFTYPISFFGWPLGWNVLSFISVLSVGTAAIIWGNKNWWIALISTPFLWNIWLGQIEFLPVIGLIITGLFHQKKIPSAWLGISWLTLITKPHVGLGILFLQFTWIWKKDIKLRELIPPVIVCISLFLLTVSFWPNWFPDWIYTLRTFRPNQSWWDASIWPYGLIALPITIYLSRNESLTRKSRMLSAASLLASPYFALYHCTTLMTITDSAVALILSWMIIFIGSGLPDKWMQWSWLLPFFILLFDILSIVVHKLSDDVPK